MGGVLIGLVVKFIIKVHLKDKYRNIQILLLVILLKNKLIKLTLIFGIFLVYLSYLFYDNAEANAIILYKIRLPRMILALSTGMILASVGNVYQYLLNNSLAEPYILGISSGAALGSTIASISGYFILMPVFGFIGALVTMIIVWFLAHLSGYFDKTKLLLSGIIVGMFNSSVLSLLMYLNQKDIGNIFNILMGNLGRIFSKQEWYIFLGITLLNVVLMIYLYLESVKLDALSTGDVSAFSLGVDVRKLRMRIFIITSLMIGLSVSFTGIIGFVGLIIPHITRMIFGNSIRKTFLYSLILGGIILLICDFLSMHLAIIEIPIGVVTSFLGSPFFVYIMIKNK